MPLPPGITRKHLEKAIARLDTGEKHYFADSTGYDVLFNGRRYPPKAVVGVAAKEVTGEDLRPRDFTGGIGSACFRVLERNKFEIVSKGNVDPFPDEIIDSENHREGQVKTVQVNRYERDPKARKKCISTHGDTCTVCEFNFADVYGSQ